MIDDYKIILKPEYKSTQEIGGMLATAKSSKLILLSATFGQHHK